MLEHGGKLREAALRYQIPLSEWVDLSTGINPNGWQPENIPTDIWNRLPEAEDGLIDAAINYYGNASLLAVAGSQAAIQVLPSVIFDEKEYKKNIGILHPAYAEHAHAWKKHGHNIIGLLADETKIEERLHELDVLVIVNPNNPTGKLFTPETLKRWHEKLASKNGWLIIDEAFMDCTQEHSMLSMKACENLIILRSIGKFFGLAGIRVGFVSATQHIFKKINETLGPWPISGPSRLCAQQALNDSQWQASNKRYLASESKRLIQLLSAFHLTPNGSTDLFSWIKTEKAQQIHEALAHAGILTRLFSNPNSLRFGLPKNETQWQKLSSALENIS